MGWGDAQVLSASGFRLFARGATTQEVTQAQQLLGVYKDVLDVTDQAAVADCVGRLERLDGLVDCAAMLRWEDEYVGQFIRQDDRGTTKPSEISSARGLSLNSNTLGETINKPLLHGLAFLWERGWVFKVGALAGDSYVESSKRRIKDSGNPEDSHDPE